ncbi:MAG: 30S ribosomal protein S3 [Chloroflexi bacterium]|nr:30S ribosomal protein S3 [Chloroflexota bacterium]
MGQKTHPIGFRLGISIPWQARWFAARGPAYSALAIEDQKIREMIKARYDESGGISKTEIERGPQELVVSIHTARPGIVIGRGGTRVDELRSDLEKLTGKRARLNIQEIRQPELDAYLVARNVAEQLERRVAFRRAMRQSVTRTMQAGAEGIKLICSGRLGGAEIARAEKAMDGRVPLHTLRANIDFAIAEAAMTPVPPSCEVGPRPRASQSAKDCPATHGSSVRRIESWDSAAGQAVPPDPWVLSPAP